MLIDSVKMFDGVIDDGVIESASQLPAVLTAKKGQVFFLDQIYQTKAVGLYLFNGVEWVAAAGANNSNGGNTGGTTGSTETLPDSVVYTYDADDNIQTITEMFGTDAKVSTYTYTVDGNVNTCAVTFKGATRTETYSYDALGNVTGYVAVNS